MTDDVNAFLVGDSSPTASFKNLGATYEGEIRDMKMVQQRDIKDGKPKFWDNGDPVMQAVITLQTTLRDPQIENDDGVRRVFIGSLGQKKAVADAIKKAGAKGLAIGGTLGIRYVRDGEASGPGMSPPKVYGAKYEPPVMAMDDGYGDSEYDGRDPNREETYAGEPNLDDYSDAPF